MVRFGFGCCARGTDLQHTAPATISITAATLEFRGWQTKTVSVGKTHNRPIPSIAPLHSFTGENWWEPIVTLDGKFGKMPGFENMDFLIPALTKDMEGFLPVPASNPSITRVIKGILSETVGPETIRGTTKFH